MNSNINGFWEFFSHKAKKSEYNRMLYSDLIISLIYFVQNFVIYGNFYTVFVSPFLNLFVKCVVLHCSIDSFRLIFIFFFKTFL